MAKVLLAAGLEIVDRDDVGALAQKRVAQMGSQEPGASGDEDELAFPILHEIGPFTMRWPARRYKPWCLNVEAWRLVQR